MTVIEIQSIRCGSTHPKVVRAAQEFPQRLFEVHGEMIHIRDSAVYFGDGTTPSSRGRGIDVVCAKCGHEWSPSANKLLCSRGCPPCGRLSGSKKLSEKSGTIRSPRANQHEKDEAAVLYEKLGSYRQVALALGRSDETIRRWLNPEAARKATAAARAWSLENKERHKQTISAWRRGDVGSTKSRESCSLRRLLHTNTPEYVFVDGSWQEVDRRETWRIFGESLLPASERKAIQELYLEAQYLTETTGIEHHVDHVQPLSKGGEHLLFNLQILTAKENLSKGGNFREEDKAELCRRLFGIPE